MKKEERTKTKEQRTMSKEQRIMKKTRKKPVFFTSLCSLFTVLCSLFIALCSLLISCDVDPDFMQRIDDEIAWRNADKLTVRLDYHSNWGSSNPQRGNITPGMDIRKGYAFSVEFSPASAYSLDRWEAYAYTESELPAGWRDNLSLLDPGRKLKAKDGDEDEDGDIIFHSDINPNGGIFTFTIKKPVPVTLIPICRTQPRVLFSEPLNDPNPENTFSRVMPVVIYFNAQMDSNTLVFGSDFITITNGAGTNLESHFMPPVYTELGGLYFVTIPASALTPPPFDSLIRVDVGKKIKNAQGNEMDNNAMSFEWYTASQTADNPQITSWSAVYNESGNNAAITVNHSHTSGISEVLYRVNNNANLPLPQSGIIPTIKIDSSSVRQGREITGIREYTITINLYNTGRTLEDTVSFKIWNYPGMSTSKSNPIVEINSAEQFIIGNEGNYVLTNSITLEDHVPIGGNDNPFKGNLYGNGHTVTINSFVSPAPAYTGLFGNVQNAVIRDLTLVYANTTAITVPTSAIDVYVGGIAGFATNTFIRNVIISGTNLSINPSDPLGTAVIRLGGIVGYIDGNSLIENSRAGLSVAYRPIGLSTSIGEASIGGIAGETGVGTGAPIIINEDNKYPNPVPTPTFTGLIIDKVTVAANVTGDKGKSDGVLIVGGAVGKSTLNTKRDISFIGGTVSYGRSTGAIENNCGGIIGRAVSTNMENCSFSGIINPIGIVTGASISNPTDVIGSSIGGIIGFSTTPFSGEYGAGESIFINGCRVEGNIDFIGDGLQFIGGVIGCIYNRSGSMLITNNFFDNGNINVKSTGTTEIGGFVAYARGGNRNEFKNCGTMAVKINVESYAGNTWVGGFTAYSNSNKMDSFSHFDIFAVVVGTYLYIGGFSGQDISPSTIERCYAVGTIRAVYLGSTQVSYIGGLVGGSSGSIVNSYALVNIIADGGSQPVFAGGLAGSISGRIENSFSKGQVVAQSTTNNVNVGGIAGSRSGSASITNTVALGAKVAAAGAGDRNAGRIVGGTNVTNLTNNHAISTMLVGNTQTYKNYLDFLTGNETVILRDFTGNAVTSTDAATAHGANVTDATTKTTAFWTGTGANQMKFNTEVWDTSTVSYRGYPILRGIDGQR